MKHVRRYLDMACVLPAASLILAHYTAKAMVDIYSKFIGGI